MNVFLEILKFIFYSLLGIAIAIIIVSWLATSADTLHYAKQNNVLLKELCVENGLNVDSLISTTQNDTLNLKIHIKGE